MNFIIISTAMIVLLTIASGIYMLYENTDPAKKRIKKALWLNLAAFVPAMAMAIVIFLPDAARAAGTTAPDNGLAYIGVALATGLATIGTGYAVGSCGAAALGAVSEDPKILGKTLIFVGLAEGIAIYGLIISIMILGQLG